MKGDDAAAAVSGHWAGAFDEDALRRWVVSLRARLGGQAVSLGLVFLGPDLMPVARSVLEIVRIYAEVPLLVGCSGRRLVASGAACGHASGMVLGLYALGEGSVCAAHYTREEVARGVASGPWFGGWDPIEGESRGWLAFFEPFETDVEAWLENWRMRFGDQPVYGGLASGDLEDVATQLYLNGEVFDAGGVVVSVGGDIRLDGLVAQGCSPVGQAWTITAAEGNTILTIGNRPAWEVLLEAIRELEPEEREAGQRLLFAGLAMNEYRESLRQGDFLIRDIVEADPASGTVVVGALPRVGQTIQFQKRDPQAAELELRTMLGEVGEWWAGSEVLGAVLCSCNGRALALGNRRFQDAALVESVLPVPGLTGLFCDGEIGPIGGRNFLHGYSASLAAFIREPREAGEAGGAE